MWISCEWNSVHWLSTGYPKVIPPLIHKKMDCLSEVIHSVSKVIHRKWALLYMTTIIYILRYT